MTDLSKRIAALSPEMRKLLLEQLKQEADKSSMVESIPLVGREANAFLLSFSQQRVWLLDQLQPGNPSHNVSGAIRLTGNLHVIALQQSLSEIVRRHEALRTTFSLVDEQPVQIVHPPAPLALDFVDLSLVAEDVRETEAGKQMAEAALHRFDLAKGPLIRASIYKMDENDHLLSIVLHHIISDGWSSTVMINELRTLYPAFVQGLPVSLPELPVQYIDYAQWQRDNVQSGKFDEHLAYWKEQLSGHLPSLQLPTDRPHPERRTYGGATLSLQLSSSLTENLKSLSQAHGGTLFMTLLAAFKVLLYRYSGQEDLIVGSPVANRNRVEFEGLVGFFINMLALRTSLSGNPSFREVLSRVQHVAMAAYEHQSLPIEIVMEHLPAVRGLEQNPLFQTAFIYQNFAPVDMHLGDLHMREWEIKKQVATLDLSLYIKDHEGGLTAVAEYNSDIFDPSTMLNMLKHYQIVLETVAANPDRRISELPLISDTSMLETIFSLSPMQEGMLFHSLRSNEGGVYIEQMIMDVKEQLDARLFLESWQQITKCHPALRTRFAWLEYPQPMQLVHKEVDLSLDQHDLRHLSQQDQEEYIQHFLQKDRERGFEMNEPPLMRLTLFTMSDAHYRCVWTFHHAILDGRSFTIILKEVFSIYDALCIEAEWSAVPPTPYEEFIHWLQRNPVEQSKDFWQHALSGFTEPNSLSFGFPEVECHGYHVQKRQVSEEVTSALKDLAHLHKLTLNTLIQGAWAILLSHYTSENDIVFGITRSGRHFPIEDADSMVGLFINTLPLRVKTTPEMRLIDLLVSLREQSIAMRPYEHTPLYKIQEWSEMPGGTSLFENILVFENYIRNSHLRSQGGKWSNREFRVADQTNYPLTMAVFADSEILLNAEYEAARFDDHTMERLLSHLQNILDYMATTGLAGTLSDIPLTDYEERQTLLEEWNNSHSMQQPHGCIHALFEAQVRRTPQTIAVVHGKNQLTYQELNQRANQFARYLHRLGAGPETIIGICMERSVEMIVGLLGILKAGAAYLPFDPTHPQDRLLYALQDSQSSILVTQHES